MSQPSVLFVCIHNAGRSQMAAAFLEYMSNGKIDVRSAGSSPAHTVNPTVVAAMLEEGIDISAKQPKILTTEAVQASDIVITMGCGDVCPFFAGKRYEDWKLADPAGEGLDAVRTIRDDIKKRIQNLIFDLDAKRELKPVVAVDLDEVLGSFIEPLCRWHNRRYATSLQVSDFHSYHFAHVWGGTDAESVTKVDEFFESEEFLRGVPVVSGAAGVLNKWKKHFDFVIVTSRQTKLAQITKIWLDAHYAHIFSDMRLGNHYGTTGAKKSKSELCRELRAVMLIDDSLAYCLECSAVLRHVVLFDLNNSYPWNKTNQLLPSNVERLSNWDFVDAALERIHSRLQHRENSCEKSELG
jgi:arsenate reductase